ncbi:MBL fold metallo-hydrolase [Streptomyces sp. NPDC002671]
MPSRRSVLQTVTAAAGAFAAGTLATGSARATTTAASASPTAAVSDKGTHLVLLGTAGGPPPFADRMGISSALVVNGRTYVIDCGRGAVTQFLRAGLDPRSLSGIFLTHLHADHTVDYFAFPLLCGGMPKPFAGFNRLLDVYGPGSPGELHNTSGKAWFNPGNPFPGTADLTRLAAEAWAYSTNAFTAEGLGGAPTDLLNVHEIGLPDVGATAANTAPPMAPFTVMENDDMKVTAILVPHGAVFPSFAYRFETADGSVVFSGDTAPTANIPALAKDASVLVHEVIDTAWFQEQGLPAPVIAHMQDVHTPISAIGRIGAESGADKVVLTHFSPGDPHARSEQWWAKQARASKKAGGYHGQIVVGRDLLHLAVK